MLFALALSAFLGTIARAEPTTVTVQFGAGGKAISPDLFGIFFEDLNDAADGGLYAELVQNRSFEYTADDRTDWHALTAWETVTPEGGEATLAAGDMETLNPSNLHYAVLSVTKAGGGIRNEGFGGIVLRAGEKYDLSLFARQLDGAGGPLVARLENKAGEAIGEARLPKPDPTWKKYTGTIEAKKDADDGRLVVLAEGTGKLALDVVSLFPQKTFRNRPNGLRADLAQAIADLKPKFMRFPGGCLVHGDGLGNMYRWKNTIGPVEQRVEQRNLWSYHQTAGLGYMEFFQFCEDVGAKPLPVVAAGVCCQNSGQRLSKKWGIGQRGLPMSEMPAYIQEVLDLIEWANGPTTSTWGAQRAAGGHPEPFHLQYVGIGNEDRITPAFRERFRMIYEAVKAKHPEITVVGTVGPFPDGEDFDAGWKIADELGVPVVDEHYYKPPKWFLDNLARYDGYDRKRSNVYVGEYAAHDEKKRPTLRSALAEAAYMTGLERNGDVVRMASYAPLLGKLGRTKWDPNLIYFTNTRVVPTINYYVQQMFSANAGDRWLPTTVAETTRNAGLATSAVRASKSGDLILKLVNTGASPQPLRIELAGAGELAQDALKTVLAGDPTAVNDLKTPKPLVPETATITAGTTFDYEAPANSLTVIRVKSHAAD